MDVYKESKKSNQIGTAVFLRLPGLEQLINPFLL
jgi:hypothetical protein